MIMVRDIELYSLCEHHMLPFFGKAHVAYIPNGRIVGLSKMPRIVDVFARRLQVQERLTDQIADAHRGRARAAGVGVVIEAHHLCMMMRGVEKQNSSTDHAALRGVFRDDARRATSSCAWRTAAVTEPSAPLAGRTAARHRCVARHRRGRSRDALARRGARVVLVARTLRPSTARRTAAKSRPAVRPATVAKPVAQRADGVLARSDGAPDIVVNNAGAIRHRARSRHAPDEFDRRSLRRQPRRRRSACRAPSSRRCARAAAGHLIHDRLAWPTASASRATPRTRRASSACARCTRRWARNLAAGACARRSSRPGRPTRISGTPIDPDARRPARPRREMLRPGDVADAVAVRASRSPAHVNVDELRLSRASHGRAMFIELIDHLRCPAEHDESFVAAAHEVVGRSVRRGDARLPGVRRELRIRDGVTSRGQRSRAPTGVRGRPSAATRWRHSPDLGGPGG